MTHMPTHLTIKVELDYPGVRQAVDTIIARAWAEGFRTGVNDERQGQGPFGAEALEDRYRDWRDHGPGALFPGGVLVSAVAASEQRQAKLRMPDTLTADRVKISCGCYVGPGDPVYTRLTGEIICQDCYDRLGPMD